MKKMILLAMVALMTVASVSHAQKARVTRETAVRELKLENVASRGKEISPEMLAKAVNDISPGKLSELVSLSKERLVKLVKYSPATLDVLIMLEQIKNSKDEADIERREIIESILDKGVSALSMNVSDVSNHTYGKVLELLAMDTMPKEVLAYAKAVSENLATNTTLPAALKLAAEKYAKAKGMTADKWLEELLRCLKA